MIGSSDFSNVVRQNPAHGKEAQESMRQTSLAASNKFRVQGLRIRVFRLR